MPLLCTFQLPQLSRLLNTKKASDSQAQQTPHGHSAAAGTCARCPIQSTTQQPRLSSTQHNEHSSHSSRNIHLRPTPVSSPRFFTPSYGSPATELSVGSMKSNAPTPDFAAWPAPALGVEAPGAAVLPLGAAGAGAVGVLAVGAVVVCAPAAGAFTGCC